VVARPDDLGLDRVEALGLLGVASCHNMAPAWQYKQAAKQ
jgi:hypothetical protein